MSFLLADCKELDFGELLAVNGGCAGGGSCSGGYSGGGGGYNPKPNNPSSPNPSGSGGCSGGYGGGNNNSAGCNGVINKPVTKPVIVPTTSLPCSGGNENPLDVDKLIGEYNDPENVKKREEANKKWQDWWNSTLSREDEKARFTDKELSIQNKILRAISKIGTRAYVKGEYQCDQYAAEVLERAGFDIEFYCVENPAEKTVDTHMADMNSNNLIYTMDFDDLDYGSSYLVFMKDNDNKLESHTGIFINGGNSGYLFCDNSSSNKEVLEGGGTGIQAGSDARDVFSHYKRYEQFCFVKLQ
ncbi:MAG: hypothetical protein K6A43_04385 [Treponema sp.]|nr:hypothetical protein [Treponema sp.]